MCVCVCVCRGELYGDMTQNLHEVRQSVAENILRLKEKLSLKGRDLATTTGTVGGSEAAGTEDRAAAIDVLKSEGVKAIQDDNADLNKQVE